MRYRALSNINYDGRFIKQGTIVDLMEAEATPLLLGGLLEEIDPEQSKAALPDKEAEQ